ncbi:MAG: hypothetical protein M1814_001837 [Vezdaea aestivalis]|nr:MAG: hypothetical protein M1814_001837 [Vezdaea aestivalis]
MPKVKSKPLKAKPLLSNAEKGPKIQKPASNPELRKWVTACFKEGGFEASSGTKVTKSLAKFLIDKNASGNGPLGSVTPERIKEYTQGFVSNLPAKLPAPLVAAASSKATGKAPAPAQKITTKTTTAPTDLPDSQPAAENTPQIEQSNGPLPFVPTASQIPPQIAARIAKLKEQLRGRSIEAPRAPVANSDFSQKVAEEIVQIHSGGEAARSRDPEHNVPSIAMDADQIALQLSLLDMTALGDAEETTAAEEREIQNAILFGPVVRFSKKISLISQFGILGGAYDAESPKSSSSPIFSNTNIPFSTFVCGLQGSGKSHTVSCLLENYMVTNAPLGPLQNPLSALVLQFGQPSSSSNPRPCELAYLTTANDDFPNTVRPSMNVLVSPSNFINLTALYSTFPNTRVWPLKFKSRDLDIGSIMSLMAVDQGSSPPLYMGGITKILREMAAAGFSEGFNYVDFKRRIARLDLTLAQKIPLQQRLDLLESYLDLSNSTTGYEFGRGGLTIVDLTCPFLQGSMACILFGIAIGRFLSADQNPGKVIVVDEAHKYMTDTPASKRLTETLLTIIREQRHFGARVVISTQEPTISPRLLDLCAVTIIHRFSSPDWFATLKRHLPAGQAGSEDEKRLFGRILGLGVGQALIFAPSAVIGIREGIERLGLTFWEVKIRKRLTKDGGMSVVSG